MTTTETKRAGTERSWMYYGWVVLAASMLGMLLSSGVMLFASIGLFVSHFEESFGWTRPQIMFALTINTIATILSAPLAGKLIDKHGARAVLLPSILIFAVILASVPFFTMNLFAFYAIIFALGFFTVGTQSITYIRVISAWFDEKRGLAIGLTASGLGLSYMLTPLFVEKVIEIASWQKAYWAMAALVLFVSFTLMALLIRNSPRKNRSSDTNEKSQKTLYGVSVRQALRTREFWVISFAIMLFSLVLTGLIPHVVPMMSERGMNIGQAAQVASVMGFATFGGRIGAGFLVDRFFAPYVAMVFFGCAAIGLFIFASGATGAVVFLAAMLIGLGFGAESDLIGYFVSRYFGLKFFGVIYGYIYGAFLVGAGLGPLLLGVGYQYFSGYQTLMLIFAIVSGLGCLLFLLLRPFPTFDIVEE